MRCATSDRGATRATRVLRAPLRCWRLGARPWRPGLASGARKSPSVTRATLPPHPDGAARAGGRRGAATRRGAAAAAAACQRETGHAAWRGRRWHRWLATLAIASAHSVRGPGCAHAAVPVARLHERGGHARRVQQARAVRARSRGAAPAPALLPLNWNLMARRLCGTHVRALTLMINGVESRFCQQCAPGRRRHCSLWDVSARAPSCLSPHAPACAGATAYTR